MGSRQSTEPVSAAEMAAASRLLLNAARRCNADVVKQRLLAARAHVDAAADDGRTALHIAVAWERGTAATKLVEAGASKNIADKHGLTPLETRPRRNRVTL
eukprot:g29224.t1